MAKKSRTPPPPRKVQAPKRRATERKGLSDQHKRWILFGAAGSGIAGVAIAVGLIAAGGGGANDKGVAQVLRNAGCTYRVYAQTSQEHVRSLAEKRYKYSFPPSGGPHFGQPALFGNYGDPVEQGQAIHNLEHGAMLIEYGPKVPQSAIDRINAFYDESPNGLLVFPYAPLGKRIALVAWTADVKKLARRNDRGYHGEGRVALCTRFDEKAFETFRDRFRAKGPERFPLSALAPGQ